MSEKNNQILHLVSTTLLLCFTVIIFLSSSASAQLVNGDFETGTLSGWTSGGNSVTVVSGGSESYYARFINYNPIPWVRQNYSVGTYTHINYTVWTDGSGDVWAYVYSNGEIVSLINHRYNGGHFSIDITGNSTGEFYFMSYYDGTFLDDVELVGYSPPPPPPACTINFNPDVSISNQTQQYFNYSVNSTYEDYMYFVTSVWHAPYNLSDLYLIENWLNVEQEGENVPLNNPFSDLQTYHLNLYATTSAPPVVSGSFLIASSNEIYINRSYTGSIPPIPDPEPEPDPYEPDPNPIEDPNTTIPDDWNMTIPSKYQNVSWLTNYTGYFDDLTSSVNNTLYSVTGLVIGPLQSLNETVYSLRYHISNSKNMVAEYSYLSVILYYGWGVLPVEMQTIFIGVAAAGACIYLFKRRT
jgi:hypothetical protein